MNINFSKLVVLLLPTFLRHTKLAYFIEACIEPAKRMYNELVAWNEEKKLELATTCQVCYLEAYLNYKLLGTFDRTIMIKDGLGTDVDFYIIVPDSVTVDTYRLQAIADKFKLTGKRYLVQGGSITYATTWADFLKQHITVTNVGQWTDFVKQIITTKRTCTISLVADKNKNTLYVHTSDNINVTTNLTIEMSTNGSTALTRFTLSTGNSFSASYILNPDVFQLVSVSPASDDNYNYVVDTTILYNNKPF